MTAKELIELLPITAENILAEAANQPVLFVKAAEYRVATMRKRSVACTRTDYYKSHKALKIRRNRSAQGNKPTEGEVKETVEASKIMVQLRRAQEAAFAEEELGKLIVEAFRHRRDSIRIIADAELSSATREDRQVTRGSETSRIREEVRQLSNRRKHIEQEEGD